MTAAARLALVALLSLGAGGCAVTIGAPQAKLDTVQEVRRLDLPGMALGTFSPGGRLSPGDDKSTTVRAVNTIAAPGGSFSAYLRSTLQAELSSAGRLDDAAPLVLSGVLTDRTVDSAPGTGTASLEADVTLTRGGTVVLRKSLSVNDSWRSSFIGAEAIPDAIAHFTGLFDSLALKILSDPDFVTAARAP